MAELAAGCAGSDGDGGVFKLKDDGAGVPVLEVGIVTTSVGGGGGGAFAGAWYRLADLPPVAAAADVAADFALPVEPPLTRGFLNTAAGDDDAASDV